MCIGILDAVFSSANSGIDDSISKLTDFLRIDQAFNLINQRRVSACSEEFFEIEATESCPFNMPWHLDIWNLQVGVETYSPGFVCVYCQIGLCQGAHTHTHIFNICQGWNCYFNLFHIWVIPVDFRSLFVCASLRGDLPKTYQSDFLHYCWYFWS